MTRDLPQWAVDLKKQDDERAAGPQRKEAMWFVHTEAEIRDFGSEEAFKAARVWTVTPELGMVGWQTDSGAPGYGLRFEDARFLADAANEKIKRDRRAE